VKYLLDTYILVYLMKNRLPELVERVDRLGERDSPHMSFV